MKNNRINIKYKFIPFKEVFLPISNNTLSRADLTYEKKEVKNIHYGDVLIKFNNIINAKRDTLPYIINDIDNYDYLKNGDIIIADTAEDTTAGKMVELSNCAKNEKIVSGLHTMAFRPKIEFYSGYLGYFMNSTLFHDQLLPLMQGSKVTSISKTDIKDTIIYFPSIDRQKNIVNYMIEFDNNLNLHKELLNKYYVVKKALIQRMFNKNLYKFNKNEWENHKLKDILIEYKETCEKNGKYEHVSLTKEGVVPKTDRYERDQLVTHENKKYRITHINDICYNPANLKFGVICRNKYKNAIFSPIYITFKVDKQYNPAFIEMCLTRPDFINYALKYQEGTVYERMAVSPEDLLDIEVSIPNRKIQDRFVCDIEIINEQIENEINIVKHLHNLRKGIIQKIFSLDYFNR